MLFPICSAAWRVQSLFQLRLHPEREVLLVGQRERAEPRKAGWLSHLLWIICFSCQINPKSWDTLESQRALIFPKAMRTLLRIQIFCEYGAVLWSNTVPCCSPVISSSISSSQIPSSQRLLISFPFNKAICVSAVHRCKPYELHWLPHKAFFCALQDVDCNLHSSVCFDVPPLLRMVPRGSSARDGCSLPHKLRQWETKGMPQSRHLFDEVLAAHGKLQNVWLLGAVIGLLALPSSPSSPLDS